MFECILVYARWMSSLTLRPSWGFEMCVFAQSRRPELQAAEDTCRIRRGLKFAGVWGLHLLESGWIVRHQQKCWNFNDNLSF